MTPSQSILIGSVVIAASIIASAMILPERGSPPGNRAESAIAVAPQPPTASRYEIIKVENDVSWRLDTVTGEITVCRLADDRMICARSTEAAELPKPSPQELEAEREERRKAKKAERNEILDRFMAFFDRIVRFAERQSGLFDQPPPDERDISEL